MAVHTFRLGPVTATGGSYPQNFKCGAVVEQTPNNELNKSKLKIKFYIWDAIGSSHWSYTLNNSVYVKLNNEYVLQTPNIGPVYLEGTYVAPTGGVEAPVDATGHLLLCTVDDLWVSHNSDGSCQISIECCYDQTNQSQTAMNYLKVTGSIDLETTRTKAEISSCPDLTLNGSNDHTVGWSESRQDVYYQVQYKVGSEVIHSGPIIEGTGSAMSYTWAHVPVDIAQYATGNTMTVTAVLNTFSSSSGATLIGDDTADFTVTLDGSSMGPIIGDISLTYASLKGTSFVSGKSTVTAAFEDQAQGGATISSRVASYVRYNDITGTYVDIAGTGVTGSSPITLGAFPYSGFPNANPIEIAVKVVVTDSRGNSSTKYSSRFTAYRYSEPAISMVILNRTDSSGAQDPNGTYFVAHVAYNIVSLNAQNEKHLSISYFHESDRGTPSAWVSPTVPEPEAYNATVILGPYPLPAGDDDEPMTAIVYCWDAYTADAKTSMEARLRGGPVFMDVIRNANGDKLSVAFGKVSDAEGEAQFGWEVVAEEGLKVVKNKGLSSENRLESDGSEITITDENNVERVKIDMSGITVKNAAGTTTTTKTWAQILGS